MHADARKPRRQCNAPPEKGTATALCPRRLLNVSLVLFSCSACPLRCRGGLNGGGGQEGFGIWRASASAAKNRIPPPSAVADCGVLLPTAPSPSARRVRLFCCRKSLRASRHPPPLNMYWVGWGGAQAFHPKEDNAPGLVSLRLPIPETISSLGCHAGGRAARTARAGFGVIS